MRKKELLNLRKLQATDLMMDMATNDAGTVIPCTWNICAKKIGYKYGVFMRCQILSGILKTAFFMIDDMKKGIRTPRYEVFINKETGEFITWDLTDQKWRNAKLDMLDWPEYMWHSGRWINPEGYRSIKNYLKTDNGGYQGILQYQQEIRKDELKKKHKRETEPWDLMLDQTPNIPKDWSKWANKNGMSQHYIFYTYDRKGVQEGYCTYCEKNVPLKNRNPKHNKIDTCPKCGKKIRFKARGKAGTFYTERETPYLIQKCEDGFILRQFSCWRRYWKGKYENPEVYQHEIRRVIYDKDFNPHPFYFGLYKQTYERWIAGSMTYYNYYYNPEDGFVYKRTLKSVEPLLQRTGLPEMIRSGKEFDPEAYIHVVKKETYVEQFAKLGLTNLVKEILSGKYKSFEPNKDFAKGLKIDKMRLKRLRENDGNSGFLEWLHTEKINNTIFADKWIKFFSENKIKYLDLKFMLDFMGIEKIYNYLKKQSDLSGISAKQLIQTYEDYIHMANRAKMDIKNELIFKPKDLKKAHDNVLKLFDNKEIALRAAEIALRFPKVEEIFESIKNKYEFTSKKYAIVVPEKIEDIIREGQILGHCLDRTDIYFDRISRQESYIIFLRRTNEIDKPYYTLEIEPGGNTRQKRTLGDKQNKDFEEAKGFIKRWQKEIQNRLSEADKKLADQSNMLREKEFEELRANDTKIWHGALAGQSLADVLEADFMAVEEEIRRCS